MGIIFYYIFILLYLIGGVALFFGIFELMSKIGIMNSNNIGVMFIVALLITLLILWIIFRILKSTISSGPKRIDWLKNYLRNNGESLNETFTISNSLGFNECWLFTLKNKPGIFLILFEGRDVLGKPLKIIDYTKTLHEGDIKSVKTKLNPLYSLTPGGEFLFNKYNTKIERDSESYIYHFKLENNAIVEQKVNKFLVNPLDKFLLKNM